MYNCLCDRSLVGPDALKPQVKSTDLQAKPQPSAADSQAAGCPFPFQGRPFLFAELFAGIGGFRVGLVRILLLFSSKMMDFLSKIMDFVLQMRDFCLFWSTSIKTFLDFRLAFCWHSMQLRRAGILRRQV